MRSFTIVPSLFALVGLTLASPIHDTAPVTGAELGKGDIFKYCTGHNFDGNCNRDDADSLKHCETVSFKNGIGSVKVYSGYKCTIYMASGCTGDSRTYTAGEVPTLPDSYEDFKTYKCVSA